MREAQRPDLPFCMNFWSSSNPSQPQSRMPSTSMEGGGPLNNLLSGGDTSTLLSIPFQNILLQSFCIIILVMNLRKNLQLICQNEAGGGSQRLFEASQKINKNGESRLPSVACHESLQMHTGNQPFNQSPQ